MLAALVKWGIGKMIYSARFFNDVELMFVGLFIIGIAGLILDHVVMGTIEKWTIEKWGMVQEG
jgi:NitT/TauT family transport system permease protein